MKYAGLSVVLSCGTEKKSLDALSKCLSVWTSIEPRLFRMVLLRILVALLPVALLLLITCVNNDEIIIVIYLLRLMLMS